MIGPKKHTSAAESVLQTGFTAKHLIMGDRSDFLHVGYESTNELRKRFSREYHHLDEELQRQGLSVEPDQTSRHRPQGLLNNIS
jgi:hypothetical protein